jgi:NADH-quinone oxidoreductase chain G
MNNKIKTNLKYIKLFINDIKIKVPLGITILQACELLNIYIPRFCYHDFLTIAGNCRMCLVEVESFSKPIPSCSFPISNNMKIYTNTPLVKKARENVLEFLLLNHPLDCPICDQGGECDLQDQTAVYGNNSSRFYEYKKSVEDKNCGPVIKTIMTRCIHCTRCIRFVNEFTTFNKLGTLNRGSKMEIGTYLQNTIINSEISGNLIDLCPVGALTSKIYAFKTRNWELTNFNGVDFIDSTGSNIQIKIKGNQIFRILPKAFKNINDNWISDKTRFFFDSLYYQRVKNPTFFYLNQKKNFKISWFISFYLIKSLFIKKKTIGIVLGDFIDIETSLYLKDFIKTYNIQNVINLNLETNNNDFLVNCSFNQSLNNIQDFDMCLLLGTNPRLEASIFNLKILKQYKKNKLKIYGINSYINVNYLNMHLGTTLNTFYKIIEGKHFFCTIFKKYKNSLIIYNASLLRKKNFNINIFSLLVNKVQKNLNVLLLNTDITNIHSLYFNLKPFKNSLFKYNIDNNLYIFKNFDLLYVIGNTHLINNKLLNKKQFVILQNTHIPTKELTTNTLNLPSKIIFEKISSIINIEGRKQKNVKIYNQILTNKEDFYILKNFNKFFKQNLLNVKNIYSNLDFFFYYPQIFLNKKITKTFFSFLNIKTYNFMEKYILNYKLKTKFLNFYKTNTLLENSQNLISIKLKNKSMNVDAIMNIFISNKKNNIKKT